MDKTGDGYYYTANGGNAADSAYSGYTGNPHTVEVTDGNHDAVYSVPMDETSDGYYRMADDRGTGNGAEGYYSMADDRGTGNGAGRYYSMADNSSTGNGAEGHYGMADNTNGTSASTSTSSNKASAMSGVQGARPATNNINGDKISSGSNVESGYSDPLESRHGTYSSSVMVNSTHCNYSAVDDPR